MRKPNLFIVGAPKCGTTSLRDYLNQHPDIWFDIDVEPNFFANDVYGFEDVDDENKYLKLFKSAKNQKYVGDKSPLHLYSKQAARRIKKFSPDSKIIIIIRNPVEMAYSWHNHLFLDGIEKIKDFDKALKRENTKKNKNGVLRTDKYHDMIRYSEQIKRYYDVFGKKNVKVLIFDDLKKSPEKVYFQMIDFLGLKRNKINYKIMNESKYTYKSYLFLEFIAMLKNSPLPVRKTIKFFIPYKVREFIRGINMKETNGMKPIDPVLKERLKREFKPEVKKVEKLISRKLPGWY